MFSLFGQPQPAGQVSYGPVFDAMVQNNMIAGMSRGLAEERARQALLNQQAPQMQLGVGRGGHDAQRAATLAEYGNPMGGPIYGMPQTSSGGPGEAKLVGQPALEAAEAANEPVKMPASPADPNTLKAFNMMAGLFNAQSEKSQLEAEKQLVANQRLHPGLLGGRYQPRQAPQAPAFQPVKAIGILG